MGFNLDSVESSENVEIERVVNAFVKAGSTSIRDNDDGTFEVTVKAYSMTPEGIAVLTPDNKVTFKLTSAQLMQVAVKAVTGVVSAAYLSGSQGIDENSVSSLQYGPPRKNKDGEEMQDKAGNPVYAKKKVSNVPLHNFEELFVAKLSSNSVVGGSTAAECFDKLESAANQNHAEFKQTIADLNVLGEEPLLDLDKLDTIFSNCRRIFKELEDSYEDDTVVALLNMFKPRVAIPKVDALGSQVLNKAGKPLTVASFFTPFGKNTKFNSAGKKNASVIYEIGSAGMHKISEDAMLDAKDYAAVRAILRWVYLLTVSKEHNLFINPVTAKAVSGTGSVGLL